MLVPYATLLRSSPPNGSRRAKVVIVPPLRLVDRVTDAVLRNTGLLLSQERGGDDEDLPRTDRADRGAAGRIAGVDGDRRSSRRSLRPGFEGIRSEEHSSELQSLMRISYVVYCLKQKKIRIEQPLETHHYII